MKKYEDSSAANADLEKLQQLATDLLALLNKEELKQWVTATDQNHDTNIGRAFVTLRVDASSLESKVKDAIDDLHAAA